jgi:Flp pilus assembly pilin Flp
VPGKRVQLDDKTGYALDEPARHRGLDIRDLALNESGSTSIEYCLIAVGIAVGITMAVSSLGSHVKSAISNLADIASASSTAGSAGSISPTDSSKPANR